MTALVVLPGLDGTATLHEEFLASVSPWFDSVTAISYPTDEALGYAALEALVRAKLPAGEPFVLLGESFSGPIALSIAARPPPNLAGLVLSTTFASAPVPVPASLAWLASIAPVRSAPATILLWLLLGRWATPELEASLQRALLAVDPEVLRFRAAEAIRVDASSCLASISAPVLYLRATRDRLLSAAAGRRILSALPQCTRADITGPHLLLQASPEDCARAVGSFASRLNRGAGFDYSPAAAD